MIDQREPHTGLHSERGARMGEDPGRSPVRFSGLAFTAAGAQDVYGDNEFDLHRLRGPLKAAIS